MRAEEQTPYEAPSVEDLSDGSYPISTVAGQSEPPR